MTLDAYTFPINTQSIFLRGEQKISGEQWALECQSLAQELSQYDEQNWLLYEDDYFLFSRYFFALLLANKNIILAQSNQFERLQQATSIADIRIGDFSEKEIQQPQSLPHFVQKNSAPNTTLDTLTISADTRITLFTSGSTGAAKAIHKYWYQLANEIACLQHMFPHQHSCVLSTVTHKHIYGLLFKLIWPVFTDKTIICETIEYPEQIEHFCQSFDNLVLISSPSYLARTSKHLSPQASQCLKRIFSSGGALNTKIANEFLVLNQQKITEIYGSTETGGIAWRQQAFNTHWQLFPNHQVSLAPDETLMLSSDFLAKGETYKTDDRVQLNGRFFHLLGRVDRIIKLHEKRLSLDEMEEVLTRQPQISACHCFVLDTLKTKAALVAVIELAEHQPLPEDSKQKIHLVNDCKRVLSSIFDASLLPRKWRFVPQLPVNSQGKLVRAELINLFE